jgi:PAS domain S-box-containing protein
VSNGAEKATARPDDRENANLWLLSEASKVLGASLDYETTLANLSRIIVPTFADWCAIDLLDEAAAEIRRVSVVHTDPAKVQVAMELRRKKPPKLNDPAGVPQVLRTGKTAWAPEVPEEAIRAGAQDPEHARILLALQIRSYICVPLVARDRVLGALTLVTAESGRAYAQAEVDLAEELGRRAGVAVDHARLFNEARRNAAALAEARERLALAVDAGELGTFYCPMPMGRIEWNAKCKEHFWLPPDADVTFDLFYAILHPDDRERTRQAVERAIFDGEGYDVEYRTVAPDGRFRWLRAKGRAYFDPAGKPTRFDGITIDITASRVAQEALRRSEETFQAFMNHSPTASWITDADGRLVYCSGTYRRSFKLPTDDLLGKLPTDLYPPEFAAQYTNNIRAVAESGQAIEVEESAPRPDGTTGQFLVYKFPIKDDAGRTLVGGVAVDVTERKRVETELRAARERTVSVLNLMSDCYIEMDDQWRLTFINEAAARLNQLNPKDVIGKTHWEIWPFSVGSNVDRLFRQAVAERKPVHFEFLYEPLPAWLEIHAYPTINGLTVYFTDITEAKRLAEERDRVLESERAARGEAERMSRMKDEFLATLSHELRTPLNAILGWSQIMERAQEDPATIREGVAVISRNARVQTQLIEDLLDMSRIISGKLRLDVKQVNVADVVVAAIEAVMPSADAREIRIERQLDRDAGPVYGDPSRLQQVVWNLLTNSVKFTPRGGNVTVSVRRVGQQIEVTVSDTGQGIAPEFLPFLFERFRQADASTTRKHGGLGIGLALVKQIVELHGGSVRVRSEGLQRGATFTFALPLSSVHADERNQTAPPHAASAPGPLEPVDLDGVKILFVDDDADSRQMGKRILGERRAQVRVAASAAEGLACLHEQVPDVLVSDIGMPEMDGYEFIRRVRELPAGRGGQTPAAALTAFARPEDRRRVLMAGFQSHIAKPVEPDELITVVASLVGKIKQR